MRKVLAGILAMATLILLALAGSGTSSLQPLVLLAEFSMPTGVLVFVALAVGAASAVVWLGGDGGREHLREIGYAALVAATCVACALLLLAAASQELIAGHLAAIALVLMVLALAAALRCIDLLGRGEPLGFESHWGGLGGGGGGWRILPTTGLAVLVLTFLGAALAVLAAGGAPSSNVGNTASNSAANVTNAIEAPVNVQAPAASTEAGNTAGAGPPGNDAGTGNTIGGGGVGSTGGNSAS